MKWPWSRSPEAPPPSPATQEATERLATHDELTELGRHTGAKFKELQQGFDAVLEAVQELASDMDRFEKDLEEGLEVARRRENRIRASVARALDELEEGGEIAPAFAAELAELQRRDGEAGGGEAVPAVQEDLGWDSPSSVPGVTVGQLRQARMM